jgi:hypothetical protein
MTGCYATFYTFISSPCAGKQNILNHENEKKNIEYAFARNEK